MRLLLPIIVAIGILCSFALMVRFLKLAKHYDNKIKASYPELIDKLHIHPFLYCFGAWAGVFAIRNLFKKTLADADDDLYRLKKTAKTAYKLAWCCFLLGFLVAFFCVVLSALVSIITEK